MFDFIMASALGVKSKLRPQFIQTLVLDEEVSDRFMDELNRGWVDFVVSASPFEELMTHLLNVSTPAPVPR